MGEPGTHNIGPPIAEPRHALQQEGHPGVERLHDQRDGDGHVQDLALEWHPAKRPVRCINCHNKHKASGAEYVPSRCAARAERTPDR